MGEINRLCRSGMGSTSNSVNTSPVLPKSSNTAAAIVTTESAAAASTE